MARAESSARVDGPKARATAVQVDADASENALGQLLESKGRWTLSMPVPAGPVATFEGHDRLGNGYDWAGVVRVLVKKHAPSIARRLRYDPEAGTFAVGSKDKKALAKVAELIRRALANRAELIAAIEASEVD